MVSYSQCETNSTGFPYIHNVIASEHAKFYDDFWRINCAEKFENPNTTEQIEVPGRLS